MEVDVKICKVLSPYLFETNVFQQYLSNSNPINVPKQLSLIVAVPMLGEQVEMVSEAAEMVEFAIRGLAALCLLFSWGLSQTGATSSAKKNKKSRLSGESFEGCEITGR